VDAIDRSLSADDAVDVSPRFVENVMAEVRAAARPATPPVFAWRWFALKLATGLSLAFALVVLATAIDVPLFAPVAAYLIGAGAILLAVLVAVRLPRFSIDAG